LCAAGGFARLLAASCSFWVLSVWAYLACLLKNSCVGSHVTRDAWPPQGGGPVQHLKTKIGSLPGPAGQTSSQASDDSTVRPIPAAQRAPQATLCAPAQSARPSMTLSQPSTLRRLTSCDVQGCFRAPAGARQQHQTDRLRPEPCKALAAKLTNSTEN
jgi:hypothetical protein